MRVIGFGQKTTQPTTLWKEDFHQEFHTRAHTHTHTKTRDVWCFRRGHQTVTECAEAMKGLVAYECFVERMKEFR